MQSKTSYFNKTIFLKNVTQYWPVWAIYLLVCLFSLPMMIYANLNAYYSVDNMNTAEWRNSQVAGVVRGAMSPSFVFVFAIIAATAVFSYLYTARSANMIHSLPMRREALFITNCISGFSFLIIPQFVTFLVSIFVCFAMQVTQLTYLLQWLVNVMGLSFFAFSFAVSTVLITGHTIAAPFFYIIFNFIYVGCRLIINTLIDSIAYGFYGKNMLKGGTFLSPWYFLTSVISGDYQYSSAAFQSDLGYIGLYCLAGILLLILAIVIYKKRHIETSGDIISIAFIKPFFRWVTAIFGGYTLALFLLSFFLLNGTAGNHFLPILLFTLFGSIVVFFLAEMLLQKNFRIFSKKRLRECGILTAIMACFLFTIELDVFGLEKRLPDESEIKSIYFNGTYPIAVNEKDFSELISIHKQVIDSKKEFEAPSNYNDSNRPNLYLNFDYLLKDGSQIARSYRLPVEASSPNQNALMNRIWELGNSPEYYLAYHFTDNYDDIVITDITIGYLSEDDLGFRKEDTDGISPIKISEIVSAAPATSLTQTQYTKVYEALLLDIREGNYCMYPDSNNSDKVYWNNISMGFHVPAGSIYPESYGMTVVGTNDQLKYTNINLTTDCTYTLSVLKELGLIDEDHVFLTRKEYNSLMKELYPDVVYYQ